MSAIVLPKVYNPKEVESKWYQFWLEKNYFGAEVDLRRKPFVIVIPPPNVTGSLHMGHALDETVQDILIRWQRMRGENVLWLPGMDHAGIITQNLVEEEIATEGLTREGLGKDKFLERMWDWTRRQRKIISEQLRQLGCSCDWSRERFTLDEGLSKAVREAFVRLYKEGLIYRGKRMINWCPRCRTAISDIEVEHREIAGYLYYINYPFESGEGFVTVATTRPETMLGDTAAAVHPEDERYRHLIGKTLILPLVGRRIPIIADERVDMGMGTGVVKITPAHDPDDFEIGKTHNLPQVVVIAEDGTMANEAGGEDAGLDRYACRDKVVANLKSQGLLVKVEGYTHSVGHHDRCDNIIEPLISDQWFVSMKPLAEPAIKAVQEGRVKFIPERWTKVYLQWMENIRDWCISRQIWWGHQIPVWYCQSCGYLNVETEEPKECQECKGADLRQDPDVLDTWFSSALWPFSTLGWPEETEDLKYFYPTSVLVTGYDIIYFWVARMIIMGLKFTGRVPFREVFIHGLVRDEKGRKMSKSLGNIIDPLEMTDKYGTDALRFTLACLVTHGQDINLTKDRLESSRNFCNKLWNASRFVLMNLSDFQMPQNVGVEYFHPLQIADRWILSRYNKTTREVSENLERYNFGEASRRLYEFLWHEYCDWYLELSKPRLRPENEPRDRKRTQYILWLILSNTLKMLHPFMPFISEEIWQKLPRTAESICVAPWPKFDQSAIDEEAEEEMEWIMEIVRAMRNIRAELKLPPDKKIEAVFLATSPKSYERLSQNLPYVGQLTQSDRVSIVKEATEKPSPAFSASAAGVEIYVPLEGLVDLDKEVARLSGELEMVKRELNEINERLRDKDFLAKAPEKVIEREKRKQTDMMQRQKELEKRVEDWRSLTG